MATFYAPKLVVQGGVVMFVGGEDYVPHRGSAAGQVAGLSTENGKVLWTAKHLSGGYQSPEDLLVIDGKMWAANVTSGRKESPTGTGEIVARNPGSGAEEKKFEDIPAYWFHHRCYPAKATEDYLIMSRTGTEFVDLKTGQMDVAPLGARRLPVRHHARQRPVVRAATSLLVLHRRQDVRVHRAGSRRLVAASAGAHSRRPAVERRWRCPEGIPETAGAGAGRMAHLPVRCRSQRTRGRDQRAGQLEVVGQTPRPADSAGDRRPEGAGGRQGQSGPVRLFAPPPASRSGGSSPADGSIRRPPSTRGWCTSGRRTGSFTASTWAAASCVGSTRPRRRWRTTCTWSGWKRPTRSTATSW